MCPPQPKTVGAGKMRETSVHEVVMYSCLYPCLNWQGTGRATRIIEEEDRVADRPSVGVCEGKQVSCRLLGAFSSARGSL